ncbi:hypothetical protein ME7_00819 [Bartonella birtlesii LL-WM9]|uniref:Uncharacterized protein n=1 Tax=Bartonella birtlesii LL-WM9 TaxID=1094552 RepID=J0Q262_9HYPH|nr:hypothetical protein ME7_00819 [Bartonella birtlesii LL-WM9]
MLAAERWRGAEALWNFGSFDGLDLARLAYAAAME